MVPERECFVSRQSATALPLLLFLMPMVPIIGASVEQIDESKRYPLPGQEVDWIEGD